MLSFPYFIYHLMYLVIQSPKHIANQLIRAADKQRQLSFYVGSYKKWQLTDRKNGRRKKRRRKEKTSKKQSDIRPQIPETQSSFVSGQATLSGLCSHLFQHSAIIDLITLKCWSWKDALGIQPSYPNLQVRKWRPREALRAQVSITAGQWWSCSWNQFDPDPNVLFLDKMVEASLVKDEDQMRLKYRRLAQTQKEIKILLAIIMNF